MAGTEPNDAPATKAPVRWLRLGVAAVLVVAGAVLYAKSGELLSLEALAARESQLRAYQRGHPVLVYGAAFLVYVLVTGLIPSATVLTLLYSWFFGFWRGVMLVSFASTAGATLSFLLARLFFRDAVQNRFGGRLQRFNEALAREGAFYLFTLRLIPVVPFFVLNLVMGLTAMRAWTYWWVSQLGMLPGTCVYVYAGSSVPSLATLVERGTAGIVTPKLIVAFVILGLFPWAARRIVRTIRPAS